jgi:hypothetical protein
MTQERPPLFLLDGNAGIVGIDGRVTDFADTAGVVEQLDLVVSTETSVAHLAASLGVRTWVLSVIGADPQMWRPMGDRSRWYPSVRLFSGKNWGAAIQGVTGAITELAAGPLDGA